MRARENNKEEGEGRRGSFVAKDKDNNLGKSRVGTTYLGQVGQLHMWYLLIPYYVYMDTQGTYLNRGAGHHLAWRGSGCNLQCVLVEIGKQQCLIAIHTTKARR